MANGFNGSLEGLKIKAVFCFYRSFDIYHVM